ncbi:hypothetical protein EJ03DRAFT_354209 [Teratosphaeria nubilosa]|uniref:Uncharacterized protein n=1 Tax=Teratosphaeria nubilosa TaxID=161662 RepID=A0A6G1L0X5_9PEZI|nr:hypothetical protein EJ03DRAFT_354209 [Teratosphaeria nubilosa]
MAPKTSSKRPLADDAAKSAAPHHVKRVNSHETAQSNARPQATTDSPPPPPQRLNPETLEPLAATDAFRLSDAETTLVLSSRTTPGPVPRDEKVFVAWISVREGMRFEMVRRWRGWCLLEYEERVVGRGGVVVASGGCAVASGTDRGEVGGRSRSGLVAGRRGVGGGARRDGARDGALDDGPHDAPDDARDGALDDAPHHAFHHVPDDAADDAPGDAAVVPDEHHNDRATAPPPADPTPARPLAKNKPVQTFEPRELRPRNKDKTPSYAPPNARATGRKSSYARNSRTPSATRKSGTKKERDAGACRCVFEGAWGWEGEEG